ncbi:hypothetical protein LWI28_008031 [Acer negundo]|uniref:Uncharacterized protein n=1 Tax=Acer negundo TaxID=4023 RepID=A0AAD5IDZ1_ACENE|nr:hypothetical protein LWI28_008031 [Acer negundo]
MATKVRILDFSVTIHVLKRVHYRFRSTLSPAATIDSLDSDELKEIRGDQRPIEDERALSSSLGAASLATVTITITRRLTTHRCACSAAGQPKQFPNFFVEVHEGLKKNWDFASRDFKQFPNLFVEVHEGLKKDWDFASRDFGLVKKKKLGFIEDYGIFWVRFRLGILEINWKFWAISELGFRKRIGDFGKTILISCGQGESKAFKGRLQTLSQKRQRLVLPELG